MGGTNPDALASFTDEAHADTFMTQYGEVQANRNSFSNDVFNRLSAAPDITGVTGESRVNGGFALSETGGLASRNENSVSNVDYRDYSLSSLDRKYDLNGDGRLDTYKITAAYSNVDGGPDVVNFKATELIPTSQSSTVLVDKGEVSTTWVLRESQTHSTSKEFNWNVDLSVALETEIGFFGTGATVRVESSVGSGGSTTTTSEFTVGSEVRDTYTIPAGAYDKGDLVSYGFHMVTGDVLVEESVLLVIDITNATDGSDDTIFLEAKSFVPVKDHFLGLVSTDFDVRDAPNVADIFDLA